MRFTVLIKGFTASLGKKKKKRGEGVRERGGGRQETSVCYLHWERGEGRVFVPLPVNE